MKTEQNIQRFQAYFQPIKNPTWKFKLKYNPLNEIFMIKMDKEKRKPDFQTNCLA
jgi:hypothetical protein